MEQRWPDRYTSNPRKEQRKGKIFVDWIRNGRSATSVAPYSLRARKGAPVSMPMRWDELDLLAPDGINMTDALIKISEEDPWKDFFQTRQRLIRCRKRGTIMEKINRPKKRKWPLILLGAVIIYAIGSQLECTVEVPKCGGLCWRNTSRRNKKRYGFCRCR